MIIYQVSMRHHLKGKNDIKVDLRLYLLSCLRISAVIHDNEIKLDDYIKVYYDSIKSEEKQRADNIAKQIIAEMKEQPSKHRKYVGLMEH